MPKEGTPANIKPRPALLLQVPQQGRGSSLFEKQIASPPQWKRSYSTRETPLDRCMATERCRARGGPGITPRMYKRAQGKRYMNHELHTLRTMVADLHLLALDMPFLLLPFRPASDPSGARTFIRNYFNEERGLLEGERLEQELMLTEPMVRRHPNRGSKRLTQVGLVRRHEMVLEQTSWWCRDMGGL